MDLLKFEELLSRQEELHPELRPYLETGKRLPFEMVRHPLVFSIPHSPQMNAYVNAQFEQKQHLLNEAVINEDWSSVLWLHERPHRLDAFIQYHSMMSDEDYWRLLGRVWIDSENIWQNKAQWKRLLKSDRPGQHHFMSEHDRRVFANLPGVMEVYRGYLPGKNKTGMSYSLYEKKAKWFAERFDQGGLVHKRKIKKSQAFAYMNGRNEHEIIVLV